MPLPDFFLIGAPKAGTTALHAALARHPGLFLSRVKEPKYFMCADRPPDRRTQRGPGDAHSAREWVWRRDRYEALFDPAPDGILRGESTPFYLYDRAAQRRIRATVPDAKLIAVLRDPVDRAYSNWMHLWSDGLETEPDFVRAFRAEDDRIKAGWAPFWHYRRLGRYGEQLEHLYEVFPKDQVHILRYRDLVDAPRQTLDAVCAFLGVADGELAPPQAENSRPFVADTQRTRLLAATLRAGAAVGQLAPPRYWRRASRPLLRRLQSGGAHRPRLREDQRRELVEEFADDIAKLERLTGRGYHDWLSDQPKGTFEERRSA
jgi:hypothetical protein